MKKIISIVIIVVVAVVVFVLLKKSPEAPAPTPITHGDWQTKSEAGKTLEYPADFGTKYISIVDWPPVLNLSAEKYSCVQAGNEIERAGQTEEKTVSGHKYCVTKVSDGAAGSTYTQYTYTRPSDSGTQVLTFTLRFVNCGNYDEPQMTACQTERDAFNPDQTLGDIFQTIK